MKERPTHKWVCPKCLQSHNPYNSACKELSDIEKRVVERPFVGVIWILKLWIKG